MHAAKVCVPSQISASSCLSFPVWLPQFSCQRECVCCVVHRAERGGGRLITADGCDEISLRSSFVLVRLIGRCSQPPQPSLPFGGFVLCLYLLLSYFLSTGNDVCCCKYENKVKKKPIPIQF